MKMTIECQHGLLARVCELCERDTEIIILRDKVEELQGAPDVLVQNAALTGENMILLRKVGELTQERDHYKEMDALHIQSLGLKSEELAASQAREAALREALGTIAHYDNWGEDGCWESDSYPDEIAIAALATSSGTTALDRACKLYAAGVLRELCKFAATHQCNFDLWLLDKAEQLRKEAE
jgi:hypothetical protein